MTGIRRWWGSLDPAVRLTGSYLFTIMLISGFFSIALYQLAIGHLAEGLRHQYLRIGCSPGCNPRMVRDVLFSEDLQIEKIKIIGQLIYFNLIILVFGGIASFWLARRTLQPIEESLEAQSRFSSDASHELRTPLAAMQTEIEVALRNKKLSKGDAVGVLESNLEEVIKLRGLSDSLLRLARQDGFEHEPVDLQKVAAESIQRLQVLADQKKIKLINNAKRAVVSGDQISLVDLASILIDNAIKYSPAKSKITITSEGSGRFGALTVKDEGPGIGEEHIPNIFERFYRADSSRTGSGGYGLGLSIAKKLADLHQGSIDVVSEPDKGSSFTVKIPNGKRKSP